MNSFKYTIILINGRVESGLMNGKDAAQVRGAIRKQLSGLDVAKIEVRKWVR